MSTKTKPIPISAAKEVSRKFGYDQVVVMARKVGNPGLEHVTTYGRNKDHCKAAATTGNFLKHKIMGWPQHELDGKIVQLEADNAELLGLLEALKGYRKTLQTEFDDHTRENGRYDGETDVTEFSNDCIEDHNNHLAEELERFDGLFDRFIAKPDQAHGRQ